MLAERLLAGFLRLRPGASRGPAVRARLYVGPRCGLCREALRILAPFERRGRLAVETVNIELDPELFRRYCLSIPVLELEGGRLLDWPFDRADVDGALR